MDKNVIPRKPLSFYTGEAKFPELIDEIVVEAMDAEINKRVTRVFVASHLRLITMHGESEEELSRLPSNVRSAIRDGNKMMVLLAQNGIISTEKLHAAIKLLRQLTFNLD